MVIILPRRGQLQNYLERVLAELENNLWAQAESKGSKKKKKKKLAEQHTCTDGKPWKFDGPFHWQSRLSRFHPLFYILICVSSSCGKDGTYSSKLA